MKASNIPYDVKKEMLDQIRNQVGAANYDKMIDALGEDGLMDLALKNLEAAPSSQPQVSAWKKLGQSLWFLFLLFIFVIGPIFITSMRPLLWVTIFYVVWWVGGLMVEKIKEITRPFG